MSDVEQLTERINAELAGLEQSVEQLRAGAAREYEVREARFRDLFVPAAKRVTELIRPRLQVLIDRFQDRVESRPAITEHQCEVVLKFNSPLAWIDLTYRLRHDEPVKNLVFEHRLEIRPILLKYEDHACLTMPLDNIDEGKIVSWFDDRIVNFVQMVAAIHQNQFYLKEHLVIDPIAGVQMPKFAAKSTLEADGRVYYFISDETRSEFEKRRLVTSPK